MTDTPVTRAIAELAAGWNAGDGERLAGVFAEDATMIDVRGRMLNGRAIIAAEHQALFDTVFRGSSMELRVLATRDLGGGLTLAHTTSVVLVPSGPRTGENRGIQTQLVRDGQIVAFQNTIQAD